MLTYKYSILYLLIYSYYGLKRIIEKFAEVIEVEDVESLNGDTDFRDLDEWSSLSVMLLVCLF